MDEKEDGKREWEKVEKRAAQSKEQKVRPP